MRHNQLGAERIVCVRIGRRRHGHRLPGLPVAVRTARKRK